VRNGRFAVTIGESQALGGVVKGSMGIGKADRGAEVKAQLQFTDVDLESAIATVFGVRRLEGRGNMALAIESSGSDVLALARAANGSATLTATRGALTGVDVEQLLRRLERRPLSGGGEFRSGRTPFDKLAVTVKVTEGTAIVEDVQLEGGAVRLALGGSASIPARDLNLKGVATLVSVPVRDNATPFELPFVVRGRWEDPIMLPDVQSLIRRSGAAAPLLDAARGGRARDAVRSAIEQLTRGAEPPQVVSPPGAPAEPTAPTQ
jgi:AsmA protein